VQELKEQILDFWFGSPGSADFGRSREEWFRKDPVFDGEIRDRFGPAVDTALAGGFTDWTAPREALARVLLLDQFTRNIFRDSPRAFVGDTLALATAQAAIARGDDLKLSPAERRFLYLPFTHAEDLPAQERSVALCARLRDETGDGDPLFWAEKHAAVIRRFGRYPHRNAILGRTSTPEEIAFLAERGSRF